MDKGDRTNFGAAGATVHVDVRRGSLRMIKSRRKEGFTPFPLDFILKGIPGMRAQNLHMHRVSRIRNQGRSQTSAKFLDFWTPSPPCHCPIHATYQYCRHILANTPPSLRPVPTSYVNSPSDGKRVHALHAVSKRLPH